MAEIIRYGNDSGTQIRKSSDYIDESDLLRFASSLRGYAEILSKHADRLYDRAHLAGGDLSNSEYKDITYDIISYGTQIRDIGAILDSYKLFSPFDYMRE